MFALAAVIVYALFAVPASVAHQPGGPSAPFTPLAIMLQLGLVVLLLGALGSSTVAIAAALAHSEPGEGVLRFVLLPVRVATGALTLGFVGAVALTILIFIEAPQLSSWPPLRVGDLLLMLIAVVVAGVALRPARDRSSACRVRGNVRIREGHDAQFIRRRSGHQLSVFRWSILIGRLGGELLVPGLGLLGASWVLQLSWITVIRLLVPDIPDFGSALLLLCPLVMATGVSRAALMVHASGLRWPGKESRVETDSESQIVCL